MSRRAGAIAAVAAIAITAGVVGTIAGPDGSAVNRTLFEDHGSGDAVSIYGSIDCASDERVTTAGGAGARGFRRVRVLEGDDFAGERCELGRNDHRDGPTALYREGKRRLTGASIRLPHDFPLDTDHWQVVLQMKQSQPSANGGGTPVIELDAYADRWRLRQGDSAGPSDDARELWSAPAALGVWTRFAFDVTYSSDPRRGRIRVSADLNGDGDFGDPGERSRAIRTYTLKRETAGPGQDGIAAGASIPSHLRIGLYHDPVIECPARGCTVDVDDVTITAPGRGAAAGPLTRLDAVLPG